MNLLNKTAFCTIVAKNYFGYARSVAQSLRLKHPESLIFCFLADRIDNKFVQENEDFILIESHELGIPNFESFCFKYDVVELATAIKPYAMKFILERYNVSKLIYLDPDIYVFQRLDFIFSLLEDHSIVLTPHITQSFPEDGKGMVDQHILLAGIYNLGFIGIANTKNTKLFLEWWQHKLYEYCLMDSANGMCVDQKWLDFAPIMFKGVYVMQKDGYNISYWNLHEHKLEYKEGTWYCDNEFLYFYHFSGFSIKNITIISKYQNRFSLINRPELKPLFEFYKELLLLNRQDECSKWAYSYGFYSDGSKIQNHDRKSYYILGINRHEVSSNPFEKKHYLQWKIKSIFFSLRPYISSNLAKLNFLKVFLKRLKH